MADHEPARGPAPGHLWGPHLFVPGNRPGFISHLLAYQPPSVLLDLEYATPVSQKVAGRHLVRRAVEWLAWQAPELRVTVRINTPQAWTLLEQDLEAVMPARPTALRVPSVNRAEDLERLDERLSEIEAQCGLSVGSTRLHPMIETPIGLHRAQAIAGATSRNEALCLGGEDWAHNCGQRRTAAGDELLHVRSGLVAAAAEHGLAAIDTVYTWLDDDEGFAADCRRSRDLGFVGRAVTNPRQIETAREIYRPDDDERREARRFLAGLERRSDLGPEPLWVFGDRLVDPRAVFRAHLVAAAS